MRPDRPGTYYDFEYNEDLHAITSRIEETGTLAGNTSPWETDYHPTVEDRQLESKKYKTWVRNLQSDGYLDWLERVEPKSKGSGEFFVQFEKARFQFFWRMRTEKPVVINGRFEILTNDFLTVDEVVDGKKTGRRVFCQVKHRVFRNKKTELIVKALQRFVVKPTNGTK